MPRWNAAASDVIRSMEEKDLERVMALLYAVDDVKKRGGD